MSRRSEEGLSLSLFSFLDIMCCTVGILMLILLAMLRRNVVLDFSKRTPPSPTNPASPIGPPSTEEAQAALARVTAEFEKLYRKRLTARASYDAKLQERNSLRVPDPDRARQRIKNAREASELRQAVAAAREKLAKILAEAGDLQAQIELEKRKQQADRAQVWFVPDPHGPRTNKLPVCVECIGNRAIIYPAGITVRGGDLADADNEFMRTIEQVREQSDRRYLLFLVRPNGIDIFEAAFTVAKAKWPSIDIGFEPIPQEWSKLNLSGLLSE